MGFHKFNFALLKMEWGYKDRKEGEDGGDGGRVRGRGTGGE